MALISLTIEESEDQVVYGFPRFVYVTPNISCNIYYSLDGSDPDYLSDIYIDKIQIPTNSLSITLKIFATNGVDESSIIEKVYSHTNFDNIRKFQSLTNTDSSKDTKFNYPFGTNEFNPTTKFINLGQSSLVVDSGIDGYSNGFNSSGQPDGYSDKPFTTENYQILYSNKNKDGTTGRGVGTLPAEVVVKLKSTQPEESDMSSSMFDPRAMVIYYDASNEDAYNPPLIMNQFMSFENLTAADAAKRYSVGPDVPSVHGTFLRSYYDPRTSTLTSYYHDNIANKWMIVKAPYTPSNVIDNLSGYVLGKGEGGRFVYKWIPFARRILF